MDGKLGHRAAAVFLLAMLLLGGLGLLATDLAMGSHRQVRGVVTEEGNPANLLAGVTVTLHDAHGQKIPLVTVTGGDGRYAFSPSPGFYSVSVERSGFYANQTEVFRFDDTANVRKDIQMERLPDRNFTLTVNVKDDASAAVANAAVELFNTTMKQVVGANTTDANGTAGFGIWNGTFELRVERETFQKAVQGVVIEGADKTVNVTLLAGIELVGLAEDDDGAFVEEGLVAFLYNIDPGTDPARRLLNATVTGSSYRFFAYPGTFILIVDADGMAANITEIDVPLPAPGRIDRVLEASPDERVDHTIRYASGDWNKLNLWRNLTLNPDSTIPGLPFAFIRHLRLQIHLVFGEGDGIFEPAELTAFQAWLIETGPKHVDTNGFFTTDDRYYRSDVEAGVTDYHVWFETFPANGPVVIASIANYTVPPELDPIPLDRPEYFVNVTVPHDTEVPVRVDTNYTVHTVPAYQRALTTTVGRVEVSKFLAVLIDPQVREAEDPEIARVNMTLELSVAGVARAEVVGPPGRFAELNASQENYTALVPTNVSMTFSAEESSDPNQPDGRVHPESDFTWTFENTTQEVTKVASGIRPEVAFEVMGNYTGNLTIVEVGENVTYRDFTLLVDGIPPVALLENNVTGLGEDAQGETITVREGQRVRFFGGNSTDTIHENLTGEMLAAFYSPGPIREWRWDFTGDGSVDATGRQVDWTFTEPGEFTVNLTVVDRAGNESPNATMTALVEDTTPPTVDFRVLDEDFEEATALMETVPYVFDASATEDNFDDLEDLAFEWSFGDGNEASGVNVTHTYEAYGSHTVILNVTDRAGNEGNATRTLVVQVDAPNRPDLSIEANSLRIEPEGPEESTFFGSVVVTIRVNVTNREDRAAASDVQVQFFALRFGDAPGASIPIEPVFRDEQGGETGNTLDPGERKTVEFTWVTGPLGNYTLRVNVTDPREPDPFVGPANTIERQVDILEAAWKRPLLIGSIVAIIVGIPVALFFRRRLAGKVRERITKK